MEKYSTKKMPQIFGERSITINPYILKILGINRSRCILRLDQIKLSCVPCRISDKGCKVLLILSRKEQEFLQGEEFSSITFHLEIFNPEYDKPIPLFFRAKIEEFQELNKRHNQCLITLSYQYAPQDYLQLIEYYFLWEMKSAEIYESPLYANKKYPYRDLAEIGFSKHLQLSLSTGEKVTGRIMSSSVNRIMIYVDLPVLQPLLDSNDLQAEISTSDGVITLNARLIDHSKSAEIADVHFITLELERSSFYINQIKPLLKA